MKEIKSYIQNKPQFIGWLNDLFSKKFRAKVAIFIIVLLPSSGRTQPIACDNTWYKRGEENKLEVSWNTPLPVLSVDDDQMPPAGPESDDQPEVTLSETMITDVYSSIIDRALYSFMY